MVSICCRTAVFSDIRAVFFDKDGTLADSREFLCHLGERRSHLINARIPGTQDALLKAFGLKDDQCNPAGLLAVGSRHENEIAAAACVAETGQDWATALEMVRTAFLEADQFIRRKADLTPLFDGILDLLNHLRSSDVQLGILSSDTTENVQDFVHRHGLSSHFSVLQGAGGLHEKPAPEFLQQACAVLEVPPETTVIVGDAQSDMRMGRTGGAAGCIGAVWGWTETVYLPDADVLAHRAADLRVLV